MPLLPPVMNATLPATSFMGVGTVGHVAGAALPEGAAADWARASTAADVPTAASAEPSRNRRRARPLSVSERFFESDIWASPPQMRPVYAGGGYHAVAGRSEERRVE